MVCDTCMGGGSLNKVTLEHIDLSEFILTFHVNFLWFCWR